MIRDTSFWRAALLRTANRLKDRRSQVHWREASFSRTEQDVMVGCYAIRKMLEAAKTSQALAHLQIHLLEYGHRAFGGAAPPMPMVLPFYNLDHARRVRRGLSFVCNQVIHSYAFSVAVGHGGGFEGVYFASDREWRTRLLFMSASELVRIFRSAGTDVHTDFEGWVEERLERHRVRTPLPPNPRK